MTAGHRMDGIRSCYRKSAENKLPPSQCRRREEDAPRENKGKTKERYILGRARPSPLLAARPEVGLALLLALVLPSSSSGGARGTMHPTLAPREKASTASVARSPSNSFRAEGSYGCLQPHAPPPPPSTSPSHAGPRFYIVQSGGTCPALTPPALAARDLANLGAEVRVSRSMSGEELVVVVCQRPS